MKARFAGLGAGLSETFFKLIQECLDIFGILTAGSLSRRRR
jgi:hypothetical protein